MVDFVIWQRAHDSQFNALKQKFLGKWEKEKKLWLIL
jgi:hypothetical protein